MRLERYGSAFVRISAGGRRFNCPLLPIAWFDEYEAAASETDPAEQRLRLLALLEPGLPVRLQHHLEAAPVAQLLELARALFLGEAGSTVRRRSEAFLRCRPHAGGWDGIFEMLVTTWGIAPAEVAALSLPLFAELAGSVPEKKVPVRSESEYAAARERLLDCVKKFTAPA